MVSQYLPSQIHSIVEMRPSSPGAVEPGVNFIGRTAANGGSRGWGWIKPSGSGSVSDGNR